MNERTVSEDALKTIHGALLSDLERRHQETETLKQMEAMYPNEEVWARFTSANQSIIKNLEAAIQEVNTALFGETWGNLEAVAQ